MNPEELVAAKAQIAELTDSITQLRNERMNLQKAVLEAEYPFKVGDMIQWDNGKGRVLDIIRLTEWKVRRIRKDGSEGCICEVRYYMKPVKI